jgi:Yip1-like protein
MATSPVPTPEVKASVSAVGRIFGVLFSPKATFEDIVRKPSWLLPTAILCLMALAVGVGLNQMVNWREVVSQQMEKSSQTAQLSEEDKEKRIEAGAKIAPIFSYVGVPLTILLVLVVALVMLGAYNVMAGVNPGYRTALGIVSHAYVPLIIGNVLFLAVLFRKPEGTLDLNNPVVTNLAAFLPEDAPKWLDALGKNVDIFITWILVLIALGFAAANPKKLKGARPYGIAFGVFAVYVVLRVGIAFVLS